MYIIKIYQVFILIHIHTKINVNTQKYLITTKISVFIQIK